MSLFKFKSFKWRLAETAEELARMIDEFEI